MYLAPYKIGIFHLQCKYLSSVRYAAQIGQFANCAGDFQMGVKMAQIVSKFKSTNAHISTVELI